MEFFLAGDHEEYSQSYYREDEGSDGVITEIVGEKDRYGDEEPDYQAR